MKFRRHHPRNNLRINLTPLIDTVFLLLVFFMMTTTFNKQSQLEINLPEAKSELGTQEEKERIRIIIDAEGNFAINESENALINNELDTLKRALKEVAGEELNPILLLSADKKSPHQAVMKALEASRDLGFVRLSFEAQQSVAE